MHINNYRAVAIMLSLLLFFNLIFYNDSIDVYAADPLTITAIIAATAIGFATGAGSEAGQQMIHSVLQKLGWTDADIQVDENGNVILSEAQMNELKAAADEYTTDSNGNDLYGQYIYQPTASFEEFMAAHKDDSRLQNSSDIYTLNVNEIWVRDYSTLGQLCFSQAPLAAVWIGSQGGGIQFWDAAGMIRLNASYVAYAYNPQYAGSGTLTSGMSNGSYCGAGHVAFTTLDAYKNWKNDGEPYTRCVPTYSGGSLVIPADSVKDTDGDGTSDSEDEDDDGDGIPDDEDDTPKGDPDKNTDSDGNGIPDYLEKDENNNTELGVLQSILKWVKKIYNQVVLGNIINAVDAVAQVMETAKQYVDEALEDVSAISELGEALTNKFPFSLPYDILGIVALFETEPITPVFEIPFRADFGGSTGLKVDEVIIIDFSMFEEAINVLKWFLGLIWLYGLIVFTPKVLNVGGVTSEGGSGNI